MSGNTETTEGKHITDVKTVSAKTIENPSNQSYAKQE